MAGMGEENAGDKGGNAAGVPPAPPINPQGYNQYSYSPPKRDSGIASLLKNPVYIGLGALISVALIWLGLLFEALIIGVSDSGQAQILFEIGIIIYNLGMAGLVLLLLSLGIGRGDYPEWLRVALVIGAVALIIWGFTNLVNLITEILHTLARTVLIL